MLTFIIIIVTAGLVFTCLLLGLLILIQLPKKDAGVGMAFGGGAADALFGAGSGNTLTKLTKWLAGSFFALVLVLGILQAAARKANPTSLEKEFQAAQHKLDAESQPAPGTPMKHIADVEVTVPETNSNGPVVLQLNTTNAAEISNAIAGALSNAIIKARTNK